MRHGGLAFGQQLPVVFIGESAMRDDRIRAQDPSISQVLDRRRIKLSPAYCEFPLVMRRVNANATAQLVSCVPGLP